jgi:hypothetical protein
VSSAAMTTTSDTRESQMMQHRDSPTAGSHLVLRQAADIVREAVCDALVAALRAAEVCGCGRCRAAAPRTFLWASAMLPEDSEVEPPSPELSSPLGGREDPVHFHA